MWLRLYLNIYFPSNFYFLQFLFYYLEYSEANIVYDQFQLYIYFILLKWCTTMEFCLMLNNNFTYENTKMTTKLWIGAEFYHYLYISCIFGFVKNINIKWNLLWQTYITYIKKISQSITERYPILNI